MTDIERLSTSDFLEQAYSNVLDKLMARFTGIFEESLSSSWSNQSREKLIKYCAWNVNNHKETMTVRWTPSWFQIRYWCL